MKKLSIALLCSILMLVFFASCSSNPEDISLADLQEPCDYIEALEVCTDAVMEIALNATLEGKTYDELSERDQERLDALLLKAIKIVLAGKKHIDAKQEKSASRENYYREEKWTSTYSMCPSFESLEAKIKKLASEDQGAYYFIQNYFEQWKQSMDLFDIGD
jgi:hypothetical protein